MSAAFSQALDQKEPEDMIRLGGSFKEALNRKWAQCCSFVAAAAVFEKRAGVGVAPPMLQEGRGSNNNNNNAPLTHTDLNGTGFRLY